MFDEIQIEETQEFENYEAMGEINDNWYDEQFETDTDIDF